MIRSLIFLCLLFLGNNVVYSQYFFPEMENFTVEDYHADNQNWDIDIDEIGMVYVANNRGLLRYNGALWYLYELPNKTIVRSVFCKDDKIYTGSYEEFGYWSRDDYGEYRYTSLINLLDPDHTLVNEDFWEITEFQGAIYFRSFGGLYEYDGSGIHFIPGTQGIVDMEVFQDTLLISIRNTGLFTVSQKKIQSYEVKDEISNYKNISCIASSGMDLLFYDELEGAFLQTQKNVVPLSIEINTLLKNAILNKVIFLNEHQIAFGTIKKGVIVYNTKDQSFYPLEKISGLYNNTVLGMDKDKGRLWVALDNGINTVNFEDPFFYYTDLSGALGTVYDAVYYDGSYYLASNTGVYTIANNGDLQFIQGSEGQVWDLEVIRDQLLVGHNNGLYQLEEEEIVPIDLDAGGIFEISKPESAQEVYLLGTYSGITKLYQQNGSWQTHQISNISFPVKKIVWESQNTIWASHPYKGIFRITLSEDGTDALGKKDYGEQEKFGEYTTNPYRVANKIVLQNSGKWFQFLKEADSIGAFTRFKNFSQKDLIAKEDSGYWFIDAEGSRSIRFVNKTYETIIKFGSAPIQERLVSGYEKINVINDSIRILNLNDGFVLFSKYKKLSDNPGEPSVPMIDRIQTTNGLVKIDDDIQLPFAASRRITFELALSNGSKQDITYKLSGRLEQKGAVEKGKVLLQNLPYGNYTIDFEVNTYKKTIQLYIAPPWYWSIYARISYVIFILFLLYVLYKRNQLKVRKQQIALQRTYIRENQERIAKIEKENLKREVLEKKRELTSSTASVIKKNEMIIELRNELNRLKEVSPNQYRTKRLLKVSKNYLGDDNDWKIFQSSFNDLHKDFFKKLLDKFPKLTTKDLKLCAYIKTGLTTKEIAPLMGITVRGVELHRYRLRKKLGLATDDNFHNFLTLF